MRLNVVEKQVQPTRQLQPAAAKLSPHRYPSGSENWETVFAPSHRYGVGPLIPPGLFGFEKKSERCRTCCCCALNTRVSDCGGEKETKGTTRRRA